MRLDELFSVHVIPLKYFFVHKNSTLDPVRYVAIQYSIIVRGNDQSESYETSGACRTYQFTLGTSLTVLTPIEQSE